MLCAGAHVAVWPGRAWGDPAAGASSSGPPRLLLATDWPEGAHPAGWLVSEKLDGVRALWDGRSFRLRGGGTVAAPGWFTERLPAHALDGELWLGRGRFEDTSATLRRQAPRDDDWRDMRYALFEWPDAPGPFSQRAAALATLAQLVAWPALFALPQSPVADAAALRHRLDVVVAAGGEGLMLHRADAPYVTGRSSVLRKLKPFDDAEGVMVGTVPGRGRLAGRMGGLRLRLADGRELVLGTGFTDAQRASPPPVGSIVTFRHRGVTESGLPRFASFLRARPAGV